MKRIFCLLASLIVTLWNPPALAEIPAPPVRPRVDGSGVDVLLGNFNLSQSDISIGPGDYHGLNYARFWSGSGWRDSTIVTMTGSTAKPVVSFGGSSEAFTMASSVYTPDDATGSTLRVDTNGDYLYTNSAGVIVRFRPTSGISGRYAANIGKAISTTYPDGTVVTYHYQQASGTINGLSVTGRRLMSVTNNLGYQLKFRYVSQGFDSEEGFDDWEEIERVTAINNAFEYCNPMADFCSLTMGWAYASYNYGPSQYGLLYSMIAPSGQGWAYGYNPQGGLTGARHTTRTVDSVEVQYQANGKTASRAIVDGVTHGYAYENNLGGTERTKTATDGLGGAVVYKSDIAKSRVTSYRDEHNRLTSYAYDTSGRLIEVTYPELNKVKYEYDGRGNVTKVTQVAKSLGPADIVTLASYPASCTNPVTCNKPTSTTDALGKVTNYSYSPTFGGVKSVTLPAGPNGVRPETRYGYNSNWRAFYKDASGAIVDSTQKIILLSEVSTCRTTASCADSADELVTDIAYGTQQAGVPNNLNPSYTQVRDGTSALRSKSIYVYDWFGNRVSVDGPLSGTADTTTLFYDAARQVTQVVGPDPDGGGGLKHRSSVFYYNGAGQVTAVAQGTANADGTGFLELQKTATGYDANARPVRQELHGGGHVQAVTQTSYDALGRVECVAQRMNMSPQALGALPASACVQGPAGGFGPDRISKTIHYANGLVHKVMTGVGTPTLERDEQTILYHNNDTVGSVTDANGNTTTYEYDGFDRLVRTRYPSPTTDGVSSTSDYEELTYDQGSRVIQRRPRDGAPVTMIYDDLGRLSTRQYPSINNNANVTFTYDNLGRPLTANRGNSVYGATIGYGYDGLGRLVSETSSQGGTKTMGYDLGGRLTQLVLPGASPITINYSYLVTGEVWKVRENGATTGVGVLATYGYDDLGRRTSLTRGNGTSLAYGYDAASRLNALNEAGGAAVDTTTRSFAFNPAGQIVTRTTGNDRYAWTQSYNVSRAYQVNGLNQYTQSGQVTPTYDARGNLTSAGGQVYSYDSDNQLTNAGGTRFDYDAMGRLVHSQASGGTRFDYVGSALVAEYGGSGTLLRRYVHGGSVDEPLLWYEGTGTGDRRFLHADERGSIVKVTNSAGGTLAINRYDEHGIPQTSNLGRFQYTGQTWLPELGMYYYKARIYSPTLGRFLQTDPIGYADGMNWYNYVKGDPVNKSDPAGLGAELDPGSDGGWGWTSTGSRGGGFGLGGLSGFGSGLGSGGSICLSCDDVFIQAVNQMLADGLVPTPPDQQSPQNDEGAEIVVTSTCNATCQANLREQERIKWVINDGRYLLNPYYDDPAPWLNLENFLDLQITLFPIGKYTSLGKEISIGKNFRLAPFGNRTYHRLGRWPHFHYRPSNPAPPGQGIARHRPWE